MLTATCRANEDVGLMGAPFLAGHDPTCNAAHSKDQNLSLPAFRSMVAVSEWVLALTRYVLLACLVGYSAGVTAAQNVPVVTRTVAIQDARIVQAPGQVIERGTVVFHRGVITAVGSNVDIPSDARIIAGDSLTVYPGFVDGLSHVGVKGPSNGSTPSGVNRAEPPDDLAGIQPDRDVVTMLQPKDSSVTDLRKLGFTLAHVVPRGRMLPGTGAIVLLTGDRPSDMVLRPSVSLFFRYEGAPAVYPATPMGIMAQMRQLVREADRRRRIERLYAENPAGLERPDVDPIHQAFYPVLARQLPVFALADGDDSALEVHRTLQLREELGFQLAFAGLHQGFEVVDALSEAGTPLFLTLDLPKKEPSDTTATDTTQVIVPDEPATFFESDLRTYSSDDVDKETANLAARQALSREQYYSTAARFHEAGLRFGFSTLGADADEIRENLQRMIEAGLPEDAALAALTLDGARLLGVDRSVGSIAVGKLANLVLVKGSYFDPEAEIVSVIVDGEVYENDD